MTYMRVLVERSEAKTQSVIIIAGERRQPVGHLMRG